MEYLIVVIICGIMAGVGVIALLKETGNFKKSMKEEK